MKQNIIELSTKDLRYIISESVKKILNEKTDLNSFKRYLTMSDDRKFLWNVKRNSGEFINYLESIGVLGDSDTYDTLDKLISNYGQYIKQYNNEILNAETNYLYGGNVDAEFQNSNMYMEYIGDCNEWLFHFTNNAYDIMKGGFLGLVDKDTTHRSFGYGFRRALGKGYAFAYTLDNLPSQNIFDAQYMIIFKAPSIKVQHRVDRDIQNIFDVKDVDKNNIYIFRLNNKQGEVHYGSDGYNYRSKPTIESMVCCFPSNLKGLQVNTPAEAVQAIEKGNYKANLENDETVEFERLINFFKKVDGVWMRKNFHKIMIEYRIFGGITKIIVPEEYLMRNLIDKFESEGYVGEFNGEYYELRNKDKNTKIEISMDRLWGYAPDEIGMHITITPLNVNDEEL